MYKSYSEEEREKYKSVTRAVTLPKYLNDMVKESGINASAILQKALMEIFLSKENPKSKEEPEEPKK